MKPAMPVSPYPTFSRLRGKGQTARFASFTLKGGAKCHTSRKNAIVRAMNFVNPGPEQICQMLRSIRTIAVVGLSPDESRPSFRVARGLQGFCFRIIPVRPATDAVLGEKAYPDLESLPELPDIVDVFRSAEHAPAIVESCIRLGIKNLWLQEGIVHEAAAQRAVDAGINVVMDRCMWRDCTSLCGYGS